MAPADIASDHRVVLVSDWHLPPEQTAKTEHFVRFVGSVCRGAGRVFVLGDLFDAWVGPRHAGCPGHAAALEALRDLAAGGTSVTFIGGNRDFLFDQHTAARFGLRFEPRAWRGRLGRLTVRLSHGDEICENDRMHKVTRALASRFPIGTLVKALPLSASHVIAETYRRYSARRRSRRKERHLRPDPRRLRAEFASGTNLVVIGHWHEPRLETDSLGLPGKTFVMLGACTEAQASYAEIQDDTVQLKTFPGQ